jgi:hypothetical protein
VIHVTDSTDVNVRLTTIKFFLGHGASPYKGYKFYVSLFLDW